MGGIELEMSVESVTQSVVHAGTEGGPPAPEASEIVAGRGTSQQAPNESRAAGLKGAYDGRPPPAWPPPPMCPPPARWPRPSRHLVSEPGAGFDERAAGITEGRSGATPAFQTGDERLVYEADPGDGSRRGA